MMIDLNALFELCLYITSYNEPNYQPYEPYYRTDYRNYLQDNTGRFSSAINSGIETESSDAKTDEFWLNRF